MVCTYDVLRFPQCQLRLACQLLSWKKLRSKQVAALTSGGIGVRYSDVMSTDPLNASDPVKFLKPPVRRVELTIYFDASDAVQASHVAPLSQIWKEMYPIVTEHAPTPPGDESSDNISVLNANSYWPIPFTRYSSEVDRRSVAFQRDRFEVRWNFDEESGAPYPGFESLLATLRQEFDVFSGVLHDSDLTLSIKKAECRYVNRIQGITAAQLAVGVLTDWQGSAGSQVDDSDYVGIRMHSHKEVSANRSFSSLVAVDKDDSDPTLSIFVTHMGDSEELGGIVHAHAELIQTFLRYTSAEQHIKWGKNNEH